MKRIKLIIALAMGVVVTPQAYAQAVVIDPSQIAASAINVADQIDYAIDQISELTNLGDKLGVVKQYVDDVFGEDGVGGKAIGILQDLGTLDRLTKSFNRNLELTSAYARKVKDGSFKFSDVNMVLGTLNQSKKNAENAVETAKKILSAVGFSKKEKKEEIDKLIEEMNAEVAQLESAMDIEMESSLAAEGLCEFIGFLDSSGTPEQYAEALRDYGTPERAAHGAVGIITLILGFLGLISCGWGFIVYMRGGITGDPTAENIFLRIGVGIIVAVFMLNIISGIINVNL